MTPGIVVDLLAIDPSVVHPAAAVFRNGRLLAASRVRVEAAWADLGQGERCARIAEAILRWTEDRGVFPVTLVYEWPQWYRASKSKGDPNDLGALIGIGAEVGGRLGSTVTRVTPTPAVWTMGTKKLTKGDPWANQRGQYIRRRLSDAEFVAVVPSHDAVDAVGLGLFVLGRMEQHRNFPGATREPPAG